MYDDDVCDDDDVCVDDDDDDLVVVDSGAAPQVGESTQVVVVGVENTGIPELPPLPSTVLINPHLRVVRPEKGSPKSVVMWESCLSLPNLMCVPVLSWFRSSYVVVRAITSFTFYNAPEKGSSDAKAQWEGEAK